MARANPCERGNWRVVDDARQGRRFRWGTGRDPRGEIPRTDDCSPSHLRGDRHRTMNEQTSTPRVTRNWGNAAEDYAKFRHGFPQSFYDRLASMGLIRPGIRV